jgi:ketosteroid isomerase-like protein
MSQENVDAVGRIYAAWTTEGSAAASGLLSPDMEWVDPPDTVDGIRIDELFDAGDLVVVVATVEDGAAGGAPHGHLWTLREGKAIRFERFSSRDDALRAAEIHCTR